MNLVDCLNAGDELAATAEDVHDMLEHLWERFFTKADTKVSQWDIEEIGLNLRLLSERLFYAIREYHLSCGTETPATESFFAIVDVYRGQREYNKLMDLAREQQRKAPGSLPNLDDLERMPMFDALPLLRGMLEQQK